MSRTVNIDKEYRCSAASAIQKFFAKHPELDYWRETFEWMLAENVNHFIDDRFANGERNEDWSYSLWLDLDDHYTYICVIERA